MEFGARVHCNEKAATGGLRKLNIGSFVEMLPPPEWLNLDILDLYEAARARGCNFQQVDVTKGLPFGDESVDRINCSHLIEHLTVDEGMAFLKECYRTLKPDGVIRICAPDTRKLVDAYIQGDMDKFNPDQPDEYKQALSQSDKFWRILTAGHKTCYDTTSISCSLELAGFKNVKVADFDEEVDFHPEVSLSVEALKAPIEGKEESMTEFNSDFYNEEYFEGTSKGGYRGRYNEIEGGEKQDLIANFLKSCFRGPMLDVGCAFGHLCAALKKAGVDARGIDISEYSIANSLPQVKDRLSVYDITQDTSLKEREFKTVVAFQTLEHIPRNKIPFTVGQMCHICDEYICIEVPTWYDDDTPDRSDTFDKSHVSFYSASFWVDQFYRHGFYLNVNLSHKLMGTDSSRLVFYREDNVPARLKDDFQITPVTSEADLREKWDDHYGVPKGYELSQPAQVKVDAALKILVISTTIFAVPAKGYSGLEQIAWEWAVEFHKMGHQVALVAPAGSTVPEGMELIPIPLRVDESEAYPLYKDRLGEFDAILDNSWLWYSVIAQGETEKQLPVIHIYHSDPEYLWDNPPPIKFPCLIGLSRDHAMRIKEKWGFPEVKFNYNGIPLGFYRFDPSIQRNGRYLWCARYNQPKAAMEAIAIAKAAGVPLDLYGNTSIIGGSDYLNQVMAACDGTNIVFHLEASREDTVKLYQSHKALIHLVNFNEPFGLVPVEAMATGMPVIVNRRGALPELIDDGVTGFVVDTLEQAEEIIQSGKVDTIKPEACRQRAEMFSIEASARGYLELFREVASGRVW